LIIEVVGLRSDLVADEALAHEQLDILLEDLALVEALKRLKDILLDDLRGDLILVLQDELAVAQVVVTLVLLVVGHEAEFGRHDFYVLEDCLEDLPLGPLAHNLVDIQVIDLHRFEV
jgi:hypothetical protein